MQYPNITQYKQAIQEAESFNELKENIEPVMNGYEPVFASGNFAVVFKVKHRGEMHALKCFLKDVSEREERQKQIVNYIKSNPSPYFVDYHYLENEIWVDVDDGNEFSVSWMKWLDAPTLGVKIREYCQADNKTGLKQLAESFKEFAVWILKQPFAHGDLKHDNLLVKPDGTFIMVDYDGMFIPAFEGKNTNELGGKSYQHPNRTSGTFDHHLDDFSILIIYTSLLALSEKPELYDEFFNGQNILFSQEDFRDSVNSKLFERLQEVPELEKMLQAIKESLNNHTIAIENINLLIKGEISLSEYEKELIKLSETLTINYDTLNNYIHAGLIQHNLKGIINTQKTILEEQISSLMQNLQQLNTNSEETNPLTEEWWHSLSEDWQDILLKNISIAPFVQGLSLFKSYNSFEDNYKNITGKDYIKPTITNIKQLLQKVYDLKILFIDEVSVKRIINLKPLSKLKGLQTLFIINNHHDLSPLSSLQNILNLVLRKNRCSDFSPLLFLLKLSNLDLLDNKISDLKQLPLLRNLSSLNLACNEISDLKYLSSLRNLSSLALDNNLISDLRPLSSLQHLKKLSLRKNTISNFSPLLALTKLSDLSLDSNKISVLSPFYTLKDLVNLSLDFNRITDLSPLSTIKNLKSLSLGYNEITDLSPLSTLQNLTNLFINANKITDISPLSTLQNLTSLKLSDNEISDLYPLSTLQNITSLTLGNNKISKLSPLSSLEKLSSLTLSSNKISNLSSLSTLQNLTSLELWNNSISDLLPLNSLKNLKKLDLHRTEVDTNSIQSLINRIIENGGEVLGI